MNTISSQKTRQEIFFIDPCIETPELEAYKYLASYSPFHLSYHSPAKNGISSLIERELQVDLKAIILIGSACSIFDNLPWQKLFHAWVEKKIFSKVPILATCYSHQLLANILGADVCLLRSGQKVKGCRKILFHPNFFNFNEQLKEGYVLSSHYEVVNSLPKNMSVLAYSKDVKYEALYHNELPILSFQSHLEARVDFCKSQNIKISDTCLHAFSLGEKIIKFFFTKFL